MNVLSSTALSGLNAAQTRLGAAANNIANMNTPGFRRDEVSAVPQAGGGVSVSVQKADAGAFSLIITDLNMPEESGISLIKRLREHTARQHLPVIVTSGHADMDAVSDLLRLQVLDLFRKPIYHVRLLETLDNLFPKPRLQLVQ